MADKEETASGKKSWLKGLFGALGGLASGVVIMYLTPWVDKIAAPAIPVPNFSITTEGAMAHFQNQSEPRGDGWWDFGDGSPLVPVSSDTEFLNHTYPRPGDYTVKLSIRNVLGEEKERSVPVHIDGTVDQPKVVSLDAVAAHVGTAPPGVVYAPATFRLVSKLENAKLCVLDLGDERPAQVLTDAALTQAQHVTFPKAGRYAVKLIAVNGALHDERTATITVAEAPVNSLSAILTVTDDATRIETADSPVNLGVPFPADAAGNVYPFERSFAAAPGYTIADVMIPPPMPNAPQTQMGGQPGMVLNCAALGIHSAQNVQFKLSADRQKLTVTGELLRGAAGHSTLSMALVVQQQRRVPAHQVNPVSATLAAPEPGGTAAALLNLPAVAPEWVENKRQVQLEVQAGGQVIWQGSQLPQGVAVMIGGRRCLLTTTVLNDQVRVDLVDAPVGAASAAN